MVFTKKATKTPAVVVETRKISSQNSCGTCFCGDIKHLLAFVLILLNTLLIAFVLFNQTKIQANQVGGMDNYKMVRQIYKTDMFKQQQTQQIQQALQMYQGGAEAAQPTQETPVVLPEGTELQ